MVTFFLGMVLFYQSFIPRCSVIAKPLFALTAGQRRGQSGKTGRCAGVFKKVTASDWSPACEEAFYKFKEELFNFVVLAHPDFAKPFILSVDASMDGLGIVLSQVPAGEKKARPIAFSRKTSNHDRDILPIASRSWPRSRASRRHSVTGRKVMTSQCGPITSRSLIS